VRRRQLHRRAGVALEQQHPEQVESLARHFRLGEVWDKAAEYGRRAGDRARAVYAGSEAIGTYNQALEACERTESGGEKLSLKIYQARGEVCQETGRFDQAEADFQMAHALSEQVNDKAGQARALNGLSYLRFQRGDYEGAIAIAQRAFNAAMAAGLQSEVAVALFNKANATRNSGHFRQAIGPYDQAAAILEELDEWTRLADCVNRMGVALLYTGDWARARAAIERGLAIRRRLDDRVGITYSLINVSYLECYRGQFASAEQAAREALDVASGTGDLYGEDAALHCLGLAILEQGASAQAIPLFQRALQIAQDIGDRPLEPEALAGLGEAHRRLGHIRQAQHAFEQCLRAASVSIEKQCVPEVRARGALLLVAADRVEEALAHARAGLKVAQALEEPRSLGLTSRVMAQVIEQVRQDDAGAEAASHYEHSIRLLREVGAEAELARSLAAYGRYLQRSAQAEKVQRGQLLLDEARSLFQRLGMADDLTQLEAETLPRVRSGQIRVHLAHADAPIGRPLRDDEYVEVTWTLAAPEDQGIGHEARPEQHREITRRRLRIIRLLREAAEQSAAPTVADLATALEISTRTIKRDLAALRAEGHDVHTRGSRARPS
jgi:tetratricopeptide (TPR) repeat protein